MATAPAAPAPISPKLAAPAPFGTIDASKIFGSIYLETDPRRKSYCFAVIYEEPEQAFADVLVYKEDSKLFADKAGVWYFTPTRDFADYALFVTKDRGQADFSIHYTKVRSYAGLQRQ
ncbi:hypothetical protein BXP70_11635 [Hymenobacter crusticola]|uniref:7(1) septoil knot domain-containing protein n=1 Tax=Hymenobacter crusticola TaxID=1770526 RepID=A0A243WDY4_9BACT|nr:hypothetical protein BXP70_11635 [Hymenobacter crusticola]